MTLLELVKAYKGTCKFNTSVAIDVDFTEGEIVDNVISFNNNEYAAVKDEILNLQVLNYSIQSGSLIQVLLLKEVEPTPEPTPTPEEPEPEVESGEGSESEPTE